jgi:hypothetical protein
VKTAILYARVSTEDQAESGLGLADQMAKLRAMATIKDLDGIELVDDGHSAKTILRERSEEARSVAEAVGCELVDDPYLFSTSPVGDEPWHPDTITQFFGRLAKRNGLDRYDFKSFRSFMDTYAQELGYSLAQVAMRAGHDPAVAGKHYTGRVDTADRRLALDMAKLLTGDCSLKPSSSPGDG